MPQSRAVGSFLRGEDRALESEQAGPTLTAPYDLRDTIYHTGLSFCACETYSPAADAGIKKNAVIHPQYVTVSSFLLLTKFHNVGDHEYI